MIIGTGIDMIEMVRVKKACEKQAFVSRIYTAEECRQAEGRISKLAGSFAVKEAVAKSLGTGFYGFGPQDIEVLRDERGTWNHKVSCFYHQYKGLCRSFCSGRGLPGGE